MKIKIIQRLSALLLGLSPLLSHAEIKTIHDVLDRDISIDVPAQRVVLGFYAEDYMAIGGQESFEHVVGISRATWEQWRPASWTLYTNNNPKLKEIPDVGEVEAQTFSIEKVISLVPDVLVLADWQYQGLGSDIQRLESAGIKIIVVDYNAQTLRRHLASTRIIGKITGQEERAQQIAHEYEAAISLIQQRLANIETKPKAYIEFGNKGPAEYSFTYGKNMWGAMLEMAGAENIAAPYVEWWGPINPEQVIASKPDVVFIAGTESSSAAGAMLMGENISPQVARERLAGFVQRPGWSELPAVKTHRIYGIYQGASRSILDASMIQYLAKALYPDTFTDLNPEESYLAFYKKYLPVEPQGTFAIKLEE
ncbi:ABC transporter substrate-binding protein [Vibrio sp.]|uniref:Iron ABC transporter substrate-binding protein n=1 Tax=Vibrio viridaestus TaxID=2487322 RepID=A0A3N9U4A7_9VIBR|nr:ABC transporter substrate-binding protein [Vibrio viridaestus]MDC0612400.1 ABC transporter substrate-binding protein [Vibrio sp.]RQW64412.1 iron ABC transporter substrate-binding protein [Vibrio viridaestus]